MKRTDMPLFTTCLVLAFLQPIAAAAALQPSPDTCLMFAASNISDGQANFHVYCALADKRIDIRPADVLEYDLYLHRSNPAAGGGIDIDTDRANLRDSGARDQNGQRAHADENLEPHASGKWYHRRIALDKLAGQQTRRWNVVFEGDKPGEYCQFIDNVVVVHADGSRDVIYDGGEPSGRRRVSREGFSQQVLLKPVPRDAIVDGADLTQLVARETARLAIERQLADLGAEVEIVHKFADRDNLQHLKQHAEEARRLIDAASKNESLDAEALQSLIHQVHASLTHEHPEMRKYAGHLVGHAHIDFQWLWEWPETIQVCHDTFGQALKFMDEFPGFKFSQSSSALYVATEEHHPQIFKGIQKRVATGDWEIVGGRVCEGDEHMISHESHARHFLYGQRYFRERFGGKDCVVGWEPDTFGHTWQMPQILLLGGCKYYYFCRGGRGVPLFWWQAPDGSKVLAFEEPATGGWYNGDVAMNRFDRLLDFAGKTGSKDMLWVYGVGNHGGGPTRENIQTALGFQKLGFLPNVKFSTATEFFRQLENYDLSKIPTINSDLNTSANAGFFGTYTSHSAIKRWNRDAEAITESAETVAAIASRFGFSYPGNEFRRNWEDITWNHHHDTLPGTSIHASYNKSEQMYQRVIESSRTIGQDALAFVASKVKGDDEGVLVFNPCGWKRSGPVELPAGAAASAAVFNDHVAPIQNLSDGRAIFFAKDLPSYGYRRYRFANHINREFADRATVSADGTSLENPEYRVTLDPARGVVTSIFDKRAARETLANGGSGNRLEIHWEEPNGMSAWVIGKINKVEPLLSSVSLRVIERGPVRAVVAFERQFQSSTLRQTITLHQQGPPEFGLATEWKELGSGDRPSPFLKVAFDVASGPQPKLTCQIPFGTIEKPTDNSEVPALKFADLSDDNAGGAALLNDSKHGYSASGNTIRLSLIRSSYHPDPRPNDRPQSARWVFFPHANAFGASRITTIAESFNHPLLATAVKSNTTGALAPEMSFISMPQENVLLTGVKKAEDDEDLVVRFYEIAGRQTRAAPMLAFRAAHTAAVNFIEDPISGADPAAPLRPHEIRTLKLATVPLARD
jgi:alpha-mannosidase